MAYAFRRCWAAKYRGITESQYAWPGGEEDTVAPRTKAALYARDSHRSSTALLHGPLRALDVVEISIELRVDRKTRGEVVCEACSQAEVRG